MRTLFNTVLGATIAALTGCGSRIDLEVERQAVKAIHAEIFRGIENGDMGPVKKYLAEDCELFLPTRSPGSSRQSKEKWAESFEEVVTPPGNVKLTVNDSTWKVSPTMAWYKADEYYDFHTQARRNHFLTTTVFEKRSGQWYVVHIHHSALPPDSVKH